MLKFAYSPWEEESSKLSKWRNAIMGILALLLLTVSLGSIFVNTQSYAQTVSDRCNSVSIYGDKITQGMDEQGDFVNKLKNSGVNDVKVNAQEGRKIPDITNEINKDKSNNNTSDCIIIDAGILNAKDEDTNARKRAIDDLIDTSSKNAKNVFWVLPSVSQNTPSGLKTAPLQNQIRESAQGKNNVYPVSIDQLSFQNDLFIPNGINMTGPGYQQRSDAVIGGMNNALNPANEDPSDNNGDNNTPSGNTNPGSQGGNTQPSGSGNSGNNMSLSPRGEAPPQDETAGLDPQELKSQGSSPAHFASVAKGVTNSSVAERYLVLGRWDALTIPARGFSFSGEANKQTINSTITESLMSLSLMVSKLSAVAIDFAFGFSFTDVILRQVDNLFAGVITGFGDGKAPIIVYFSSIITFTIIMSALTAFNTRSGASIQSRITGIFTAVVKAIFAALLVYFMGVQSSKNAQGSPPGEMKEIVEVFQQGKVDSVEDGHGGEVITTTDSSDIGTLTEGRRTIARPGTWHALSLGWIVSMVFYIAQLLVAAILSLYTAIIKLPLDSFQDNINPISEGGTMPACDRYVDSMHQTFMATQVYQGNHAYGDVRLALDKLIFNYLYQPYSSMYGGMTVASRNSWCWALEINSGRPVGEWLMLSRGAGLYNDVARSGSLIIPGGGKYNNGRHNIEHTNTIEDVAGEDSPNHIVQPNGEWVNGDYGVVQAQIYMGIYGGTAGREQARYYFAACRFDPGKNGVLLHEWLGVMPMYKGYGDAENVESKEKTRTPEYGSENLLNDMDCRGSQIIPIDTEQIGEYGFGSVGKGEVAAQRWQYTLPDENIFSGLAETVVDGMASILPFGRGGGDDEGDNNEGDNATEGADTASNVDEENGGSTGDAPESEDGHDHINEKWAYNPRGTAKIFWDAVNGLKGSAMALVGLFILALSALLLVDFAIILIPIMIIKAMAALIFILVPLSIMFSAIGYAFRGGRK